MLLALPAERPADRALARQLWLQGLDQEAGFHLDSAIALYRRASMLDVTFFPAFLDHMLASWFKGNPLPYREDIERRADLTAAERRCLLGVSRLADDRSPRWVPYFRELQQELGPTPCVRYGLASALQAEPLTRAPPSAEELRVAMELARQVPDHYKVTGLLVNAHQRKARPRDAMEVALRAARVSPHILHRQRQEALAISASKMAGDTARMLELLARGDTLARRDGRGFVRYDWLVTEDVFRPHPRADDRYTAAELVVARSAPSRVFEVQTQLRISVPLAEAGRMKEVLARIQPFAEWVERNDLHEIGMRLRHLEGRALVRSGRPREAITALEKAARLATVVGSAHFVAEANHQLTHAYEGIADWRAAAAASLRFIASAQRTTDPGIRVISYRDAATVHWKAGWTAGADSLYRLMVRAIERERTQYAFAAEYYERVGNFAEAMRYLRLAAMPQSGSVPDPNVLYATLTRLHLALGNLDSAMVSAARHDSLRHIFDEVLVPRVLIAKGEHARAITVMRQWTNLQAERGNVRGQIKALVSLAEGLLPVAPMPAIAAAAEADSLALAHAFVAERVTAMRLRGEALRSVDPGLSTRVLSRAREMSLAHPEAMERILVEIALGASLERAGDAAGALVAFESAIRAIEQMGSTASDDITLSRFRAARTAAFDGALRIVRASDPRSARADAMLRWSVRKKQSPGFTVSGVGLSALRRRLRNDEALIDYVVIDSTVTATVVTGRKDAVVPLPLSTAETRRLATRLVRAFAAVHGGRVDLARAAFDDDAASRLYDGLIVPLLPHLAGVRSLTIVPDAPVHAVPFDALMTARPTEFLIDRFIVRYALAPVAGSVANIGRDDRMLLLVGDAPGAAGERDRVAKTWRGRVAVLDAASESRFVSAPFRSGVLHIASHARSDDRDPLASYLALARDSINDGMLHYSEIERLPNRFSLVVLNACETSGGELLPGSGFMSLARAFLISGSSAVIATQWPVGAASAALAERFYERLASGASADVALRDAKLTLRNDRATAHPFFWASHVLLQRY